MSEIFRPGADKLAVTGVPLGEFPRPPTMEERAVWRPLQFGSGWGNFGAGYQPGEFTILAGRVWLRGLVTKSVGTPTGGDTIATLPLGFRPPATLVFAVATGETSVFGRVDVSTAGVITWRVGGTAEADFTSLDNISFDTASLAI